MKPLKEHVSITLGTNIVERVKLLAQEDDRSFSQFVNKILRDYLCRSDAPDSREG